MQNEKYLPLGTVCLLNGGKKFVMVNGYLGVGNYIGVIYPVGAISSDVNLLFNHEQIEKVIFRGFESDECKEFLNEMKNVSKEEILSKMKEEQYSTQGNNSFNQTAPEVYTNPQ